MYAFITKSQTGRAYVQLTLEENCPLRAAHFRDLSKKSWYVVLGGNAGTIEKILCLITPLNGDVEGVLPLFQTLAKRQTQTNQSPIPLKAITFESDEKLFKSLLY